MMRKTPAELPEDERRHAFFLSYYGEPLPW
jgi:hypothetical protein